MPNEVRRRATLVGALSLAIIGCGSASPVTQLAHQGRIREACTLSQSQSLAERDSVGIEAVVAALGPATGARYLVQVVDAAGVAEMLGPPPRWGDRQLVRISVQVDALPPQATSLEVEPPVYERSTGVSAPQVLGWQAERRESLETLFPAPVLAPEPVPPIYQPRPYEPTRSPALLYTRQGGNAIVDAAGDFVRGLSVGLVSPPRSGSAELTPDSRRALDAWERVNRRRETEWRRAEDALAEQRRIERDAVIARNDAAAAQAHSTYAARLDDARRRLRLRCTGQTVTGEEESLRLGVGQRCEWYVVRRGDGRYLPGYATLDVRAAYVLVDGGGLCTWPAGVRLVASGDLADLATRYFGAGARTEAWLNAHLEEPGRP